MKKADERVPVERVACAQAGVVSRRQLYDAGVTRAEVRANLRARRWRRVGSQAIVVHTGPLTRSARHWAAVFEAGPRAYLDGASSLVENGVEHLEVGTVRVSVPRGVQRRRGPGLDIRQTRRFDPGDLVAGGGVPRTRIEVAAVRAALWAPPTGRPRSSSRCRCSSGSPRPSASQSRCSQCAGTVAAASCTACCST